MVLTSFGLYIYIKIDEQVFWRHCQGTSFKIDILTKKGITNLEIFLSFSLLYGKFQKNLKNSFKGSS